MGARVATDRVATDRIGELLREESKTPEATDPVDPGRLVGRIELRDVHFIYPGTDAEVNLAGHISVTPLRADLTAHDMLTDLAQRLEAGKLDTGRPG